MQRLPRVVVYPCVDRFHRPHAHAGLVPALPGEISHLKVSVGPHLKPHVSALVRSAVAHNRHVYMNAALARLIAQRPWREPAAASEEDASGPSAGAAASQDGQDATHAQQGYLSRLTALDRGRMIDAVEESLLRQHVDSLQRDLPAVARMVFTVDWPQPGASDDDAPQGDEEAEEAERQERRQPRPWWSMR